MTAQEVFEKEWEIWRAGRAEFPSRREINDRKGTAGDAPVKVGEMFFAFRYAFPVNRRTASF